MKWNDRNIWWYKVRPFQCQFDILTSHCPTWASLESLRSSCSRFEWIGFYGCHLWIGIPTWPITIMADHHLNMSCIVKRIKHNSILDTGRSVSILSQYLSHKYRAVLTWLDLASVDLMMALPSSSANRMRQGEESVVGQSSPSGVCMFVSARHQFSKCPSESLERQFQTVHHFILMVNCI